MNKEIRTRILLSAQSALLGNITNNIRCISCDLIGENIVLRAVFDGEVADEDIESMEEAGSQVASHFDDGEVSVECVRIDTPNSFVQERLSLLVYQRKE
jgi:hypothetical protein